jgi:hypothetical protein
VYGNFCETIVVSKSSSRAIRVTSLQGTLVYKYCTIEPCITSFTTTGIIFLNQSLKQLFAWKACARCSGMCGILKLARRHTTCTHSCLCIGVLENFSLSLSDVYRKTWTAKENPDRHYLRQTMCRAIHLVQARCVEKPEEEQ